MRGLAFASLLPATLIAAAGHASPPEPVPGESTTIPFAARAGVIRNFEAAPDEMGVYLQDNRGNWYFASFDGKCEDIRFEPSIGFDTRGSRELDHFGAIIVNGFRCEIDSLFHSAPPADAANEKVDDRSR